jgi:hypothetical protein
VFSIRIEAIKGVTSFQNPENFRLSFEALHLVGYWMYQLGSRRSGSGKSPEQELHTPLVRKVAALGQTKIG